MPRAKQQGTPGKGYANRTDLMADPDMTKNTAATGGLEPGNDFPMPQIGADDVPNLSDPTQRPQEPVTTGLGVGAGLGPEAMGNLPPSPRDPVRMATEALMLMAPNADLQRILNRLDFEGR